VTILTKPTEVNHARLASQAQPCV